MSLTTQQAQAVNAPSSVSVTAGAGTGKTHMLSERYIHHIKQDQLSPLQIVAVTFTEKAATELRSRIREKIYDLFDPYDDVSAKFEAAPISTLHSIAARICRDHFEEAGVAPDFQILDEIESMLWKEKQFLDMIESFPLAWFKQIPFSLIKKMINTAIEDPLAATTALEIGPDLFKQKIKDAHRDALQELVEIAQWQDHCRFLESVQGAPHDKLEPIRASVVQALYNIENNQNISESLEIIKNATIKSGIANNWEPGVCQEVKDTIKLLREPIKNNKNPLLICTFGASDDRLEQCYPIIKEMVHRALSEFETRKRRERILTYSDLEIHALRALEHEPVRNYYAARWKTYLIDEFQDTNITQEQILLKLCQNATITIVGDIKQSIYGFRRADIEVFLRFQDKITSQGGIRVSLDQSFRSHEPLVETINQVFAPVLNEHHQNLSSTRTAPHESPFVRFAYVPDDLGERKFQKQQYEAQWITNTISTILDSQTLVYDPQLQQNRPAEPKDIAILSRTWEPLDCYLDTLQMVGIPAVVAAGGSLLETREAQDAIALLSFLAEPDNSIALAAVLRSPFFTISDISLYHFIQEIWTPRFMQWKETQADSSEINQREFPWWSLLTESQDPDLLNAHDILGKLLHAAEFTPPHRLLLMADEATGYTAVIGNLPNAERRITDWRGFVQWVIHLEEGDEYVFGLVRNIKLLQENEAEIKRLPIESGNSVSLMTIHSAKGLEWPIVFVPDLARKPVNKTDPVLFDPNIGFAVSFPDTDDANPLLYSLIQQKKKNLDAEESKRLLYVAFTRARDALYLTATKAEGPYIELLQKGFQQASIPSVQMDFTEARTHTVKEDSNLPHQELPVLLKRFSTRLDEIYASDITTYAQCPYRFYLSVIQGYQGISAFGSSDQNKAQTVGTLTHQALEMGISSYEQLKAFNQNTNEEWVEEAFQLSQRFWLNDLFQPFHHQANQHEVPMVCQINGLSIRGIIDCLGPDFVLDYKTGEDKHIEQYRFQVAAYAIAKQIPRAVIADLRHCVLKVYENDDMENLLNEIESICHNIASGLFEATPSKIGCSHCPFNDDRVCSYRSQSFE